MNKHILFVFALIAICTASESLQMKSSNIGKAAAAAQKASDALSFMENANMQVDTLSDQAMSNLEDTNANLSSLQDIANNQESFPGDIGEAATTVLGQAAESMKEADKNIDNTSISEIPALDSADEKAFAALLTSLQKYNSDATAVQAVPIATIPDEVTGSLLKANQAIVDFENKKPPEKKQPLPRGEMGNAAIKQLLAFDPVPKVKY